jgi:glycosyltransferase involved in cell wall biosynthesis
MPKLYVLTPLRDEAENIPRLVETLRAQTRPIDAWVVLENGSTDGSKEMLREIAPGEGLGAIEVLNLDLAQKEYALGHKYASIVKAGIDHLRATRDLAPDDMVALLDADTFLHPRYYEAIEAAFAADPRLGMACGRPIRPGKSAHETRWTGGGYFVWRQACLAEAGYIVGPSADVVSATKAHLRGWDRRILPEIHAETRGMGDRVDFRYYGRSAYFRGETLPHALAVAAKRAVMGRPGQGWAHVAGYVGEVRRGAPRTEDGEILAYFRGTIGRRLRETLRLG